ncbi:MAG: class I SAM-dependent methyltransferase [Defluviitaleaceae bacterium]|nr:class I SAM-dependent methyltransferase [Defluviitaleaceae bacterium]
MTYLEQVHKPWGQMFYDLAYMQLNIPNTPRLRILDFGSGVGLCANHYAKWHDVTAIEPSADMIACSFTDNKYEQIHGGIDELCRYKNEFDLVICHNVLEYIREKEEIIAALTAAAKPGGQLSIIKHNIYGRVIAAAVFDEDPKKAMNLFNDINTDQSRTFGERLLYENHELLSWADKHFLLAKAHYGIRAMYALGQNNEIKFDPNWYEHMLALESMVGDVDEFRRIAFLNHFVFEKVM